jgi:hypothetical protein
MQQAQAAGTVDSIEAVTGSQADVEEAFDPGGRELAALYPSLQRASVPLALVVMHGQFDDLACIRQ